MALYPACLSEKVTLPSGAIQQGSTENALIYSSHTYLSHCAIPDITRKTIVVGVCGAHDCPDPNTPGQGYSHPGLDGWFWSDWALFHHLLRGTSDDQTWIAGVNPADLVKRYSRFVQGDPGTVDYHGNHKPSDRRVVLDASTLPTFDDVLVFPQNTLRDQTLSEIRAACQRALAGSPEDPAHVLLLFFGHGEIEDSSVNIGAQDPNKPEEQDLISPEDVQAVISEKGKRRVPVTILSTSCWAGRWALIPDVTTFLASDLQNVSNLWSAMPSQLGSIGGSHMATAIVKALARSQIPSFTDNSIEPAALHTAHAREQATLAAEVNLQVNILADISSEVQWNDQPMYSAENDEWEANFGKRSGFPLTDYQARWNSLQQVPGKQAAQQDEGHWVTGGRSRRHFVGAQTNREVGLLAYTYYHSFPGGETVPGVRAFNQVIERWLKYDQTPSAGWLATAETTIFYRMYVMRAATIWAEVLGLGIGVPCNKANIMELTKDWTKDDTKEAFKVLHEIQKWPMFDWPIDKYEDKAGLFPKGWQYLMVAFTTHSVAPEEVDAKLEPFFKNRDPTKPGSGFPIVEGVSRLTDTMSRVRRRPDIQANLGRMAKSIGRQIRDLSPVKGTPSRPKRASIIGTDLFAEPGPARKQLFPSKK